VLQDAGWQRCRVHYEERRIMWMSVAEPLSQAMFAGGCLHSHRLSRKASSASVGR
jgi:hypothetical protein